MRFIVCGGRDYEDSRAVYSALDRLRSRGLVDAIITGGYQGADKIAENWAESNGIPHIPFMADWEKHGKAAGPMRNQRMLKEGKPDGVIAFPGGRGTSDMIRQAKNAGLKVWEPCVKL